MQLHNAKLFSNFVNIDNILGIPKRLPIFLKFEKKFCKIFGWNDFFRFVTSLLHISFERMNIHMPIYY